MKKHEWKDCKSEGDIREKMREMIRDGRIRVVGRQQGMPVELKVLCLVGAVVGGFLVLAAIFGV